jgi:prolyl 4-hydroxylase
MQKAKKKNNKDKLQGYNYRDNLLNVRARMRYWWRLDQDIPEDDTTKHLTWDPSFSPSNIKRVDLNLEDKPSFLLYNVLTPLECEHLIKQTEQVGYDVMPEYSQSYRSNTRVIIDDRDLAECIWNRIKDQIPPKFKAYEKPGGDWIATELNERWRFCRYVEGQHFSRHCDSFFMRSSTEKSRLTFMLYLNGGFEGGATIFLPAVGGPVRVEPEAGLLLVFQHNILHEGEQLRSGKKYIMRSDVMYTCVLNEQNSSEEDDDDDRDGL